MDDKNPLAVALGNLIRRTAEKRDLTLVQLSERSGIPRGSLYRYIDGERDMQLSVLTAIAGALNEQPDALLHEAMQAARRDAGSL